MLLIPPSDNANKWMRNGYFLPVTQTAGKSLHQSRVISTAAQNKTTEKDHTLLISKTSKILIDDFTLPIIRNSWRTVDTHLYYFYITNIIKWHTLLFLKHTQHIRLFLVSGSLTQHFQSISMLVFWTVTITKHITSKSQGLSYLRVDCGWLWY